MTSVKLNMNVETQDISIPPMLLITFVENCFKHGVSSIEPGEISAVLMILSICLVNQQITFNKVY